MHLVHYNILIRLPDTPHFLLISQVSKSKYMRESPHVQLDATHRKAKRADRLLTDCCLGPRKEPIRIFHCESKHLGFVCSPSFILSLLCMTPSVYNM